MFKKSLPIFLALVIAFNIIPVSAFAAVETPTKTPATETKPPPSYVGQSKTFYIENPKLKDLPKKEVVPERPIPTGTKSPKVRSIVGLTLSVFLSTPEGQKMVQDGTGSVDKMATAFGNQIQGLSNTFEEGFITAYDSMLSDGSTELVLGQDSFTQLNGAIDRAFIVSDVWSTIAMDPDSSELSVNGMQEIIPNVKLSQTELQKVQRIVGAYNYSYEGVLYATLYTIAYDGTLYYSLLFSFQNSSFIGMSTGNAATTLLQATNEAMYNYQNQVNNYAIPYGGKHQKNYWDIKSEPLAIQDPSKGSYKVPATSNLETTPSIQSIGDTNYWKVPATDTNGESNIHYALVTNPSIVEPEKIIIDEKGAQIYPDGTVSETPVIDPSTVDYNQPVADPEPDADESTRTDGWLATIALTLSGIASKVGTITDSVLNCKCTKIPDTWNPFALLLPYLAFMSAVVMFLVNISAFIVKMPFVPQKEFEYGGEVVEWFKHYQVGPIVPYDLLLTLIALLISLFIYKMIRRNL